VELHNFLNHHDIPYLLKAQMNSYYSDAWIRRENPKPLTLVLNPKR
jgi:hypothetical protein